MQAQKNGFTLIEMMITIALLAIFVALAGPSFREIIVNNRAQANANLLVTSLNLARSEALKTNAQVTLCKSTDGVACATAGTWDGGWIVFADLDADEVADVGELVVQVQQNLGSGYTLAGNAATNWMAYRADGSTLNNSGGLGANTFFLCPGDVGDIEYARQIVLSATGRARVEKGATAAECGL